MASLTEALVGYEKEKGSPNIQYLEQCTTKVKDKSKPHDHSEVTFVTEEMNANDYTYGSSKLGVIVWVDREEFVKQANK